MLWIGKRLETRLPRLAHTQHKWVPSHCSPGARAVCLKYAPNAGKALVHVPGDREASLGPCLVPQTLGTSYLAPWLSETPCPLPQAIAMSRGVPRAAGSPPSPFHTYPEQQEGLTSHQNKQGGFTRTPGNKSITYSLCIPSHGDAFQGTSSTLTLICRLCRPAFLAILTPQLQASITW